MASKTCPSVATRSAWLWSILIAAVLLRLWAIPDRYEFRDVDELGYLQGGLQLIEGLAPPLHYAPAAPEAWYGWARAGLLSCRYMVRPTAEERQVPLKVRPFTAVNHALFDLYRDMSGLRLEYIAISMLVSVLAVVAGFRLGMAWGGLAGAALLGAFVAFVPMIVEHTALAKPYSLAWSCAILSLYFASRPGPRSRWASAILMGLAISSRIEMLTLLPLACVILWASRTPGTPYVRAVLGYIAVALVTAQLVAPWLLTNLLGNLRAIFTVRLGPAPGPPINWQQMLRTAAWDQALGPVVVLIVLAAIIAMFRRRPAEASVPPDASHVPQGAVWWLLIGFTLFMSATMLQNTGYGMRHHGPAVIALLIAAPLAVSRLSGAWPRSTWGIIALATGLCLVQSIRRTWSYRRDARPEDATAWIEKHVPAGTVVYTSSTFHDLLPTPQSADATWNEVAGSDAPARKFKAALDRFGLSDAEMPRALSEQMMLTERSGPRRTYILGSRAAFAGPRYTVRRFYNSPVFGLQDPLPGFAKTGCVLVWRNTGPAPGLADPVEIWADSSGNGTYLYVSPDLRARLVANRPSLPH